jgi:hypothetical protein
MKPLMPIIFPLICLLAATGCTAATGPHLDTGCPPGQVRVEDEHTGEYDCASEQDYQELMDHLDEHGHRDRG